MYLERLDIWNFRKFGSRGENSELPGVVIPFHQHFNLLIGENDAGKTAIMDAIKLVLGTTSEDNNRISEEDFHIDQDGNKTEEIKIECIFTDLNEKEAGLFLEWLTFNNKGEFQLEIRLTAKKVKSDYLGERIEKVVKAGSLVSASRLEGITRELIRATYLKPLRDAENELKPGIRSRLAQILKNHQAFRANHIGTNHVLEQIFEDANQKIKDFFDEPYQNDKTIKKDLTKYLDEFFHISSNENGEVNPDFSIVQAKLNDILRKLSLNLNDKPSGLGSLNLLFIATELLLYNEEQNIGSNLTLIEEIEAHLHPQAQLRLIKYLQNRDKNEVETQGQFILTTHSTTLASSIKLENIILLHNDCAYPMGAEYTKLDSKDYKFLERFLDSTKANLFFAKGVIFVEGDAENLLLPTIAELIERPLHKYGVSIVNIGNIAFKRYSKIYSRSDMWLASQSKLNVPVSIVTDVDIRPLEYYLENKDANNKVYIVQNTAQVAEISEIVEIPVEELEILINSAFSSKKSLKETLQSFEVKVSTDKVNEVASLIKTEISNTIIEAVRESKLLSILRDFEDENTDIRVFVAPNWTLEYEIALSELKDYLVQAIHNSRFAEPLTDKNRLILTNFFNELRIGEKEEAAYKIYKPLLNKSVSKAMVAQELAELLVNDKDKAKGLVQTDPYLKYLRDSIYHVTGGE